MFKVTAKIRRRYIMGRQGLWPGRRWAGKAGADQAMRELEAVQIDPVLVVAQSHDIKLWSRVLDYRPEQREHLMYEERRFFDYGGALKIYPMAELPFWRPIMERMKGAARWRTFAEANPILLDEVRTELRHRGPLRNRELDGRQVTHYRASKDTGVALYYLWLTGDLMTHHRHGKERVYDFAENVAPAEFLHAAEIGVAEDYFARKVVAQDGLVSVRSFRNRWRGMIGRAVTTEEAEAKIGEMKDTGELAEVQVEGEKERGYFPASDVPLLEELHGDGIPQAWQPLQVTTREEVVFLSPLDYVSARGRAKILFGFDYIWEIYKPAAQRKYGPYTMPILYGDRLVARLDAKFERPNSVLRINGFWPEAWFEPDADFAEALAKGLARFRAFLGAER